MDHEELESMQLEINRFIYDKIAESYEIARGSFDDQVAAGIIVSCLATNLGIILAQIPDSHRQAYSEIAASVIETSTVSTIESLMEKTWGQVGHA